MPCFSDDDPSTLTLHLGVSFSRSSIGPSEQVFSQEEASINQHKELIFRVDTLGNLRVSYTQVV
jgi:hypothetical protein